MEQMIYRFVYFKPNSLSKECLLVGVIFDQESRLHCRIIPAGKPYEALEAFFGEEGVEAFNLAIKVLRETVSESYDISSIEPPSSILEVGEELVAVPVDPRSFVKDLLASESMLLHSTGYSKLDLCRDERANVTKRLYSHISMINPLLADRILNQRIELNDGRKIDIPIYGSKIFGATFSFEQATSISEKRMKAESAAARYSWLEEQVNRRPRLYIYVPDSDSVKEQNRIAANVREVREISEMLGVGLSVSQAFDQLAATIVNDEVA